MLRPPGLKFSIIVYSILLHRHQLWIVPITWYFTPIYVLSWFEHRVGDTTPWSLNGSGWKNYGPVDLSFSIPPFIHVHTTPSSTNLRWSTVRYLATKLWVFQGHHRSIGHWRRAAVVLCDILASNQQQSGVGHQWSPWAMSKLSTSSVVIWSSKCFRPILAFRSLNQPFGATPELCVVQPSSLVPSIIAYTSILISASNEIYKGCHHQGASAMCFYGELSSRSGKNCW